MECAWNRHLSIRNLSQIRTLSLDALNDDGTLFVGRVVDDALHNVILTKKITAAAKASQQL